MQSCLWQATVLSEHLPTVVTKWLPDLLWSFSWADKRLCCLLISTYNQNNNLFQWRGPKTTLRVATSSQRTVVAFLNGRQPVEGRNDFTQHTETLLCLVNNFLWCPLLFGHLAFRSLDLLWASGSITSRWVTEHLNLVNLSTCMADPHVMFMFSLAASSCSSKATSALHPGMDEGVEDQNSQGDMTFTSVGPRYTLKGVSHLQTKQKPQKARWCPTC